MHYNSLELQQTRSQVKEALLELGWEERECRYPADGSLRVNPWIYSPQVNDICFDFEEDLKSINSGEAYYRLETLCGQMVNIGWRCCKLNKNVSDPLDVFSAQRMVRAMCLNGIAYDYEDHEGMSHRGKVIFISWDEPEANKFSFICNWRGLRNDGFGWDFVLLVNSIPFCAIILAPDAEGQSPCQAAWDEANRQLSEDAAFRAYAHAVLYSNGRDWFRSMPLERSVSGMIAMRGDTLTSQLGIFLEKKSFVNHLKMLCWPMKSVEYSVTVTFDDEAEEDE